MPSFCLRGRERGQQVWSVCLVRIISKGTCGGDWCVVTWHDCTKRGWGYLFQPPPPPQQGRARTRAIRLIWADMERPQMMSMAVYTGRGLWSRATLWLHLVKGGFGLPSSHRLGRASTLSFAHTIFNHNFKINFKSKFQTHFEIIF
jgi:hypothetical protein